MGEMADDHVDWLLNGDYEDEDEFGPLRRTKQPYRWVTIHGHLVHETELAYLWNPGDKCDEEWIPKTQTSSIRPDSITITTWIADKKGWI